MKLVHIYHTVSVLAINLPTDSMNFKVFSIASWLQTLKDFNSLLIFLLASNYYLILIIVDEY